MPTMNDDAQKPSENPPGWERDLIARLASSALIEQRRARRWGIFFKLVALIYLFGLLMMFGRVDFAAPTLSGRHTALVDVSGLIVEGEEAGADNVITALRSAYEDTNKAGVIVRINSPGGSPV